jgi:hypothetical protein
VLWEEVTRSSRPFCLFSIRDSSQKIEETVAIHDEQLLVGGCYGAFLDVVDDDGTQGGPGLRAEIGAGCGRGESIMALQGCGVGLGGH